jgi:lysophospholipase L1-like esterase
MRVSSFKAFVFVLLMAGRSSAVAGEGQPLQGVRRVVFVGDSITYAGQYIDFLEAYLRIGDPQLRSEFLNLGLPSETVSGLSEPGHAGGQFPRPELRERLDRVLEQTRPGLVVACYGMNDGIYYPFSEARFAKFQEGMRDLRQRSARVGARVLHVTPPVFDPAPIKSRTLPGGLAEYRQPFEGYDEVLDRYSSWLLAQREKGWDVVDVHGPMKRYLAAERARDPSFRLADDGVHTSATGHWLMAREILLHWGVTAGAVAGTTSGAKVLGSRPHGSEVLKLVKKRQSVLRDAWLTATGHRRPGMTQGLPLREADGQAREIEGQIRKLVASEP